MSASVRTLEWLRNDFMRSFARCDHSLYDHVPLDDSASSSSASAVPIASAIATAVAPAVALPLAEGITEEFQCSICSDLIYEASALACSHTFCRSCLEQWFKTKLECPLCRMPQSNDARPVRALDAAIDVLVSATFSPIQKAERATRVSRVQATAVRALVAPAVDAARALAQTNASGLVNLRALFGPVAAPVATVMFDDAMLREFMSFSNPYSIVALIRVSTMDDRFRCDACRAMMRGQLYMMCTFWRPTARLERMYHLYCVNRHPHTPRISFRAVSGVEKLSVLDVECVRNVLSMQ